MGTYVKDGNSCIGCSLLNEFPGECGSCNNLKSQVELIQIHSKLEAESDRAFSMLSVYGVPKGRAGTISNGIDVLATRYKKEINMDAGEKAMLWKIIRKTHNYLMETTDDRDLLIEEIFELLGYQRNGLTI